MACARVGESVRVLARVFTSNRFTISVDAVGGEEGASNYEINTLQLNEPDQELVRGTTLMASTAALRRDF